MRDYNSGSDSDADGEEAATNDNRYSTVLTIYL